MVEKPDPFDIDALERSVNDSAIRVSTIWISYLIFGLYLMIATSNVTHRQLLLEDPLKLPALNIELPLLGFFIIAPSVFLILHLYLLIQLMFLTGTAITYNEAVNYNFKVRIDNARIRKRLANTLFSQLLAGSPDERKGLLGSLLWIVCGITLAVIPLVILITFELKFLPYHSIPITWGHRILITIDMIAVVPSLVGVVYAQIQLSSNAKFWPGKALVSAIIWLLLILPIGFFCGLILSMPDEPQAGWTRTLAEDSSGNRGEARCVGVSWFKELLPNYFDRIYLANELIIDEVKYNRIEENTVKAEGESYLGERTNVFKDRDFYCGIFDESDLRRTDFARTKLSGASFIRAKLDGAFFDRANLDGASLRETQARNAFFGLAALRGTDFFSAQLENAKFVAAAAERAVFARAQLKNANFSGAQLHGAIFTSAEIQGGEFIEAQLPGANFRNAKLQNAEFREAQLQGAFFSGADLRAASLFRTQAQGSNFNLTALQGVSFVRAELQGSVFIRAQLQGADLNLSQLQGAYFNQAQFQGTNFGLSTLSPTLIADSFFWRSSLGNCTNTSVIDPQFEPVVAVKFPPRGPVEQIVAQPDTIAAFIKETTEGVPEPAKQRLQNLLEDRLLAFRSSDITRAAEEQWRQCRPSSNDEFERTYSRYIIDLACETKPNREYIAAGLIQNWTVFFPSISPIAKYLPDNLYGPNGRSCPKRPTG